MKKQISTEQTDENIKEVLRLLAETPTQLERLSKGISEKQLHEPLGKGERSFTEGLAHIINCEALTAESIYLALLVKEPMIASIHAERDLGKLLRFDQLPFSELMAYFKVRRKVLLSVLEPLTAAKWSRSIREEKRSARSRSTGGHEVRLCMSWSIWKIWKRS